MITETLLAVALGLVNWIVWLVPDFGLELALDLAGAFGTMAEVAGTLNGWVPVAYLAAGLALLLGIQAAMTIWGFIVWLYHQFWGSN